MLLWRATATAGPWPFLSSFCCACCWCRSFRVRVFDFRLVRAFVPDGGVCASNPPLHSYIRVPSNLAGMHACMYTVSVYSCLHLDGFESRCLERRARCGVARQVVVRAGVKSRNSSWCVFSFVFSVWLRSCLFPHLASRCACLRPFLFPSAVSGGRSHC